MNGGRDAHLKELRLARERRKKDDEFKSKYIDNLSGIDKLEFEIGNLKNTIKLCEYDLKSPTLSNNQLIMLKLENAKKLLNNKLIELETLKNEKNIK